LRQIIGGAEAAELFFSLLDEYRAETAVEGPE
jgi:hypothetical protein